jgi:hypothetical protein
MDSTSTRTAWQRRPGFRPLAVAAFALALLSVHFWGQLPDPEYVMPGGDTSKIAAHFATFYGVLIAAIACSLGAAAIAVFPNRENR